MKDEYSYRWRDGDHGTKRGTESIRLFLWDLEKVETAPDGGPTGSWREIRIFTLPRDKVRNEFHYSEQKNNGPEEHRGGIGQDGQAKIELCDPSTDNADLANRVTLTKTVASRRLKSQSSCSPSGRSGELKHESLATDTFDCGWSRCPSRSLLPLPLCSRSGIGINRRKAHRRTTPTQNTRFIVMLQNAYSCKPRCWDDLMSHLKMTAAVCVWTVPDAGGAIGTRFREHLAEPCKITPFPPLSSAIRSAQGDWRRVWKAAEPCPRDSHQPWSRGDRPTGSGLPV